MIRTTVKSGITPIEGEIFRFHVEPQTPGVLHPYLVDLEALDGNGQCDCMDFCCRHAPKLKERKHLPEFIRRDLAPLHCKHITACQTLFMQMSMQIFRRNEIGKRQQPGQPARLQYIKKSDQNENRAINPPALGMANR